MTWVFLNFGDKAQSNVSGAEANAPATPELAFKVSRQPLLKRLRPSRGVGTQSPPSSSGTAPAARTAATASRHWRRPRADLSFGPVAGQAPPAVGQDYDAPLDARSAAIPLAAKYRAGWVFDFKAARKPGATSAVFMSTRTWVTAVAVVAGKSALPSVAVATIAVCAASWVRKGGVLLEFLY